jgi:hypothetical protein
MRAEKIRSIVLPAISVAHSVLFGGGVGLSSHGGASILVFSPVVFFICLVSLVLRFIVR